ncbi:MAG TPA: LLM class F420-dependent oxidoreductase [Stellaceae bacterium]|jgi:probable F420-dependent oxidoreductase|nr:LLM class F420-dependent oxidoreductase [Stellaceae bacterium]
MTVRFSCRCPNTDYLGFEASPEAIIASAQKAEELDFDAIFVNDHIIVDESARSAPWTNCFDPMVSLAYVAAHTSRIKFGVSVLIVPYRNPVATAKALATLDRMSGGRLIAGVGVGWNEAEFAALGVPFRERGARTDEYLRLWQTCWAPGKVSFAGRFFAFSEMFISPKPVQQPGPPFWVGGLSDAALRRAVNLASVWQPTPTPLPDLIARRDFLRQASEQVGRPSPPETRMSFRVVFSDITGSKPAADGRRAAGHGTPKQVAEDLLRYREEAGLEAFQINFHGCNNLQQLLDSMECFMRDVKPLVS